MSWRTIATVLIVLFTALIVWSATADPLRQVGDHFEDVDDGDGRYDIPGQIDSMIQGYYNMFLVLAFGLMAWALWRVVRRELTRGGVG